MKRISIKDAEKVCKFWHYTKTCATSSRFCVGAWENGLFVGVVVFANGAALNLGKSEGYKSSEVCELVRVALSGKQTFTSQIVSRALRFFKDLNPDIRVIYSFADQNQDHFGTIYQAMNWIYLGESKGSPKVIDINGNTIHNKTFSELKSGKEKYRKVKQKNKYKYIFALNRKDRKRILKLHKPYPKMRKADRAT